MLRSLRKATFQALKACGASAALGKTEWRRRRLLVLCFHGVPIADEHEWRPQLYMPQAVLRERFELIQDSEATVLPLSEALQRLYAGSLPRKSVAITFDDGGYDFYERAYPVVREFAFPVTVYQTTYYADFQRPIFNLACSYMLWKHRGTALSGAEKFGISGTVDLSSETGRAKVMDALIAFSEKNDLSGAGKDEVAESLAARLGFDYPGFSKTRLLQLMTPAEIAELSSRGVDFQLHTHRHRTPRREEQFRREIRDNRTRLEEITGRSATHFCYPSGVYCREFLPWLEKEAIASATTCEPALATPSVNGLLIPRLVDTSSKSSLEFAVWLDGVGPLLSRRPPGVRI
jgi:peptidoglycan/xylan/chitin deacetylase (PgdA/CDA1 family)